MGKEAKTEIVKIRMTAKEKAELQKLAGQHHMNIVVRQIKRRHIRQIKSGLMQEICW